MNCPRGHGLRLVLVALACGALTLGSSRLAAAQEWHPRFLHAAVAASMTLHGADAAISMYEFGRDPQRYREANPLLRRLSDRPVAFGVAKMGLAVAVNYALLRLHAAHPKLTLITAIVQGVAVGYVVHHNARQQIIGQTRTR